MERSRKKGMLENIARVVDTAVNKHFTKEQVMTASAGGKVMTGTGPVLYRWKSFPVLLDEEGMLDRLLSETGNQRLIDDYQLVKLARERKAIQ
jgi:hypothetical protein